MSARPAVERAELHMSGALEIPTRICGRRQLKIFMQILMMFSFSSFLITNDYDRFLVLYGFDLSFLRVLSIFEISLVTLLLILSVC